MSGSGMGDDSYGSGRTSTGMGSDTYGVSKTRYQILYMVLSLNVVIWPNRWYERRL